MPAPRPSRPIEDHCEQLPESCRQRWAELLAERRTARREDDREEAFSARWGESHLRGSPIGGPFAYLALIPVISGVERRTYRRQQRRFRNKQGDAPMPASTGAPPPYTRFSRVPLAQALPLSGERTLFPWPGGKTRLAKHLLPLINERPHTCYVEAFAGSAAMLFEREPAKVEVLNDMHGELVRLYRVVANHLDEFVRHFRWSLTSREMYRWAQLQHVETLTDIQRAARFYYLQKLSFGGKVEGQTLGVGPTSTKRINLLRLEQDLSDAHLRLHGVVIEQLTWQRCIEKYDRPETLFLLDPPYWETTGYGAEFGMDQYEQLAEVMAQLKGRAILTINDHAAMRALFDRFNRVSVPIRYTVGGGAGVARRTEMTQITPLQAGGVNVVAFLEMLAWSEGTCTSPATKNRGYDVIVTGADRVPEVFTDYSVHPFSRGRKSKRINSKGLTSNASGRYQFMLKDYAHYRALLKLSDFGPLSQDLWAIQLIRECRALPLIQAGKVEEAIGRVRNIWASLPGAGYGQPEHKLSDLLAVYRKAGGTVAP
uniref:site-specific DNA-methyltransferase (adenine-specific) n=1 Tax=Knufia peltigerae TaxID=1002370 RepID=A0AA38XUH8_9EURO|nr:hypothetical protein H2204_011392 [Knufia peltigerae]